MSFGHARLTVLAPFLTRSDMCMNLRSNHSAQSQLVRRSSRTDGLGEPGVQTTLSHHVFPSTRASVSQTRIMSPVLPLYRTRPFPSYTVVYRPRTLIQFHIHLASTLLVLLFFGNYKRGSSLLHTHRILIPVCRAMPPGRNTIYMATTGPSGIEVGRWTTNV